MVVPPIIEPVNVTLFGKRVFADVIKNFEMRSSWVIWRGPKPNNKCPYTRYIREILMEKRRPRESRAEIGAVQA